MRGRRSKYGAKRSGEFASGAEARRAQELKLLEAAGEISELKFHPCFPLIVNGAKVGRYTADFLYLSQNGEKVVEEVKGYRVRDYVLRCKLFRALYPGFLFREVRA